MRVLECISGVTILRSHDAGHGHDHDLDKVRGGRMPGSIIFVVQIWDI